MTLDLETRELVRDLRRRCEAGARFIRSYHKNPEELRAWAARIESGWAPNAVCGPAMALERGAQSAAEFLAEHGVDVDLPLLPAGADSLQDRRAAPC